MVTQWQRQTVALSGKQETNKKNYLKKNKFMSTGKKKSFYRFKSKLKCIVLPVQKNTLYFLAKNLNFL